VDYVLSTVKALETLGYRDHDLHLLAERLRQHPFPQPLPDQDQAPK
jgi:cation transport regulator ChaC